MAKKITRIERAAVLQVLWENIQKTCEERASAIDGKVRTRRGVQTTKRKGAIVLCP